MPKAFSSIYAMKATLFVTERNAAILQRYKFTIHNLQIKTSISKIWINFKIEKQINETIYELKSMNHLTW